MCGLLYSAHCLPDHQSHLIQVCQFHDESTPVPNLPDNNGTYEQKRDTLLQKELDAFQAIPCLPLVSASKKPTDPLVWFKRYEAVFPHVADVARAYLAVPASSASSERVFSDGGNIVRDKRSRLWADNASDLIVLKGSWEQIEQWDKKRKLI